MERLTMSLDEILKRLLADVDDDMEFIGTMWNPKNHAHDKVNASLDLAKDQIKALMHELIKETEDDRIAELRERIKDL